MVQSLLNKSINYIETDRLAKDDENYPTIGYEIVIDGINRTLALGQAKYSFIDKNIIYFPIYLIINDEVYSRVGVYEIYQDQLSQNSIFDEDGDVDPDKLGKPLYFSYFNRLLKKLDSNESQHSKILDDEIDKILSSDKSKLDGSLEKSEKEGINKAMTKPPTQEKYIPSQSNFWVEKFLKDNHYKIKDNEGDGDCLFATIRDAYKTIKQDYSVAQLRQIVSSKATQEIFENYKSLYNSTFAPIDKLKAERDLIIIENKKIIDQHRSSKDRDEQQRLRIKNKELIQKGKELLEKIKTLEENLDEVDYIKSLKNVNTLEEFKQYIKSCDFWGESWAISILEEFLKIKLVLLSSEEYEKSLSEKESFNKVLFCGDIIHPQILKDKTFSPVAYIILDYTGIHFKLITYNNLGVFTFDQLPEKIKILMKKCEETREGSYHLIPDIKKYVIPTLSGGKKTRVKREYNKKTRKKPIKI
jgi:hypothetical protein